MLHLCRPFLLLPLISITFAQPAPEPPPDVWVLSLSSLQLRPAGFLEFIETSRSATLSNSVNTAFGNIPLSPTPHQNLFSFRHSRLQLTSDLPLQPLAVRTYLEGDFMTIEPGKSPYRWRQYWGQMKVGRWEILGGKAWSLLRPNRRGIASDVDVMNTDVVEPAYHVGLVGARRRQLRLTRSFSGNFTAAVAWEAGGNTVAKLVRDTPRLHWEAQTFGGTRGHLGVGFAAVCFLRPEIRLITQDIWSRHAISEALGVVPVESTGGAMIQGVEWSLRPNLELYSYGGLVQASRTTGNHLVSEWSVGINHTIPTGIRDGRLRLSLEFSHIARTTWSDRSGRMDYFMAGIRYSLN